MGSGRRWRRESNLPCPKRVWREGERREGWQSLSWQLREVRGKDGSLFLPRW